MSYIQINKRKDYQKKWYQKNKEKMLLCAKKRYQEKKQDILSKRKELRKFETIEQREKRLSYFIKYRKINQGKIKKDNQTLESKFRQYTFAAGRRGYGFNLTFDEFIVLFNGFCAYCGKGNARGIDRIDNKVGYTKNNSISCCEVCNKMKWKYNKQYFLNHIKKIYKFNKIIKWQE